MWLNYTKLWGVSPRALSGNVLGFHGCTFSPQGDFLLGHGYYGGFHAWEISPPLSCTSTTPNVSPQFSIAGNKFM